ncbi:MAG: PAS domain S-box protein [Halohasta sp.]
MTGPDTQLQVLVVGNGSAPFDGGVGERRVSVSMADSEALAPEAVDSDGETAGSEAERLADADCLVVDRPAADAWRAVVERVADRQPELPVVVFFEEPAAVGEAIAAGADDYLPRSLADRRPSLVVDRLAAVADSDDSGPAVSGAESTAGREESLDEDTRELFESVADGLVVHDPETGEIRDCNPEFCAQTGYDRAELVGEPVDRVVATGEGYGYAEAKDRIRRASEGGPQLFEWRGRRKSGETYPVEVSLRRATIGGRERVVASVRDITERREKERRLAAVRNQRSTLFANSPDPIVAVTRVDDRPQVTDVNPAFESTFGFEAEAVVGKPLSSVIVPENRRERYEGLRDRALGGEQIEAEVRRETADGMRDFLLRVLAFETDVDDHAYVWYTDITERRERERALERERDRRSVLFANNPDPVAGIEFDGDRALIREVNPAFESTFGFAAEAVVGEPVAETVVPTDGRDEYARLRRRAAAGEAIEGEAPRLTADGQRRFVFRVIQFNDDPGTTDAYVWYTDVTDRRRHERAVESLQAATGRMQRAETAAEIAEIAVEAATEALELPTAVCWLHDDDRRRLDPVAATEGADEAVQQPIEAGSELYDRFETDEVTRCRPEDGAAIEGLLLPLGDPRKRFDG